MMKQRINKFFYEHAVRKPTIALAITGLLIITVIIGLNNVEVNRYLNVNGKFIGDISNPNELIVEVKLDRSNADIIENNEKAIWYFKEEGKRYSGDLHLIINSEDDSDHINLRIKPEKLNNEIINSIEDSRDVFVKLYVGKEKVINRIIK